MNKTIEVKPIALPIMQKSVFDSDCRSVSGLKRPIREQQLLTMHVEYHHKIRRKDLTDSTEFDLGCKDACVKELTERIAAKAPKLSHERKAKLAELLK